MVMDRGQVIQMSKHWCPSCGRPMQFNSMVPRFGAFPELRTFECNVCGVMYTEATKPDEAGDGTNSQS